MQYAKTFHLFNSVGIWIGFCLGQNLFDTDMIWKGWFPWDSFDAVNTCGWYLGTVVGNRLYWFDHKKDHHIEYYPGYPAIPFLSGQPKPADAKTLPFGAFNVNLKAPAKLPVSENTRRVGRGAPTRRRK